MRFNLLGNNRLDHRVFKLILPATWMTPRIQIITSSHSFILLITFLQYYIRKYTYFTFTEAVDIILSYSL
jgi:hypothetical protein